MNSVLWIARLVVLVVAFVTLIALTVIAQQPDQARRARNFIAAHEAKIRPLEKAVAIAWWNANVSGKDEDFKAKEEAQNKLDEALADKERFAELKAVKEGKL